MLIFKQLWFVYLFLFLCVSIDLYCLDVCLISDIADIVSSEKIFLRFHLDRFDQALYHDSLRFSIDSPNIELKNWEGLSSPAQEYVAPFKCNKKIYTESFNLFINLEFVGDVCDEWLTYFKNTNINVACLVLGEDGVNRSKVLNVFCSEENWNEGKIKKVGIGEVGLNRKQLSEQRLEGRNTAVNNDLEILFFERLNKLWNELLLMGHKFFEPKSYFKIYVLTFVVSAMFVLSRFLPIATFFNSACGIEVGRFFVLFFCGLNFYFLRCFFQDYLILIFLAVLCVLASFYYLCSNSVYSTRLNVFKTVLGIFLMTMVFAILVKTYFLIS